MAVAMFKDDLLEALGAHFSSYTLTILFAPVIDKAESEKKRGESVSIETFLTWILARATAYYEILGESFSTAFPRTTDLIVSTIQVHYQKY